MLRSDAPGRPRPVELEPGWAPPADAVWLDLVNPTRKEELAVEAALGVSLPTRDDMVEIEASSRLYQEDGATFMTAAVIVNAMEDAPKTAPITFVLVKDRLVTVRYVEPKSFKIFADAVERQPQLCASGPETFLSLLDAVIDRLADILEVVGAEVDEVSSGVYREGAGDAMRFQTLVRRLGRAQALVSKARESLVSLSRLISFSALAEGVDDRGAHREHLKSLQRDSASLTDHASYLSNTISFSLQTAMGLITLEQNAIVKTFSVASVALLPPTLIASIYGMNFRHMPELAEPWGYPLALLAMVASVAVPLLWFRKRGWL